MYNLHITIKIILDDTILPSYKEALLLLSVSVNPEFLRNQEKYVSQRLGCGNNSGKGQTCIDIVIIVIPSPWCSWPGLLEVFQSWLPKSYLGIRRSV